MKITLEHHTVLEHTILVEIHQASAQVPVEAQGEDVEHDQDGEGGQEVVGLGQDVEGAVSQESYVDVIAQGDQPEGVPEHGRDEPVTFYLQT